MAVHGRHAKVPCTTMTLKVHTLRAWKFIGKNGGEKKTLGMGASLIINPIHILYSGYVLGPNPLFLGLQQGSQTARDRSLHPQGFSGSHHFFPYEKKNDTGALVNNGKGRFPSCLWENHG